MFFQKSPIGRECWLKVTRVHCLQAMKGDCSSSPAQRMTLIVMVVIVTVRSAALTGETQTFIDQPWDVTVVAGDKVSPAGTLGPV